MPNRILRDGINSSSRVNTLSFGAEILYRRLISVVDDYGRYYAAPATVRGACWPSSPDKVTEGNIIEWMGELQKGAKPLLTTYYIDNCMYLEINDFGQQRRSKSKFPEPCAQTDVDLISDCDQVDITSRSRSRISESKAESDTRGGPIPIRTLPKDTKQRIRTIAENWPDPQDLPLGIEMAIAEVTTAANPDAVLGSMEENLPLWASAMLDGRAKIKQLRWVIKDAEYLRKPREPTKTPNQKSNYEIQRQQMVQRPNPRLTPGA